MTSSEAKAPNYARRIILLGIFAAMLFGGYSVFWFYFADRVEAGAKDAIAEMNHSGVTAECTNAKARGFPFRMGLYCDHVAFADASNGIGLTAGEFRSAGQIYDLSRFVAELDGPARLDLLDGRSFDLVWEALRASVRLAEPLPQRLSVEAKQVDASLVSGPKVAHIGAFEAHMRPNGADVDLAANVQNLDLAEELAEGRKLPTVSSDADLTVTNGVETLARADSSLRGQAGTIRSFTLTTGSDTGLTLSGPFSISDDGLVSADLKVTVRDPKGLSTVLADAFPEARDQITGGFAGLIALGDAPSLPLKIDKGRAMLGFIPLGKLPRL